MPIKYYDSSLSLATVFFGVYPRLKCFMAPVKQRDIRLRGMEVPEERYKISPVGGSSDWFMCITGGKTYVAGREASALE